MPEDLANQISQALEDYNEQVSEGIEKEAKNVANEARDELKDNSPRRTGNYANSWSRRKKSRGSVAGHTVYNKEHYQLTHLLEFGFSARDGSRVAPRPHIEVVEQKYSQLFVDRIEKIIEKAGD